MMIALTGALLAAGLLSTVALQAQAQSAELSVLDRNKTTVTQFVDGDLIQLKIKLPSRTPQPTRLTFAMDQATTSIAECTVPVNGESCETEPLTSLGWAWDKGGQPRRERTIRALTGNTAVATVQVRVSPRPVILAHGFIGSADAWSAYLGPNGFLAFMGLQGFAVGDGQVEGKFSTGSIADPAGKTNTIAQNAEILKRYISNVKKLTGAQQVDVVGHSMGGLISRYYIDRLMTERDVAQLIMLGTPQNGSDCANLPAALDLYLPASLEIRPSYIRDIFNSQITRRRGVQFYALAGTPILEAFKSPCTGVPSDIAVSLDSARGISLSLTTLPLLHTDLNLSKQVFESFVRPLLEKPAGEFQAAPDPALAVQDHEALQFTRIYTGHVDVGGSQEVTVNIDQVAVASFALYDPTRSLTVTVRGASGNVIALDPARNGLIVVDDPATLVYLGYGFQNPRPGPWRVTLAATSKTPARGTEYALTAQLQGGAVLKAQVNPLLPKPGEPVELTARLELAGQALPIRQATALIRGPNGKAESMSLTESGDRWTAAWKPASPGVYGITVQVSGSAPDGTPLEREASLSIQGQPSANQVASSQRLLGAVVLLLLAVAVVLVLSLLIKRRKRQAGVKNAAAR
jgi:pimeloyl-ACP methyl ester carboxylesterase